MLMAAGAIHAATPDQAHLLKAYQAAEHVLDANLAGLIRNERVQPVWIGEGDAFWYQRDGDQGPEWVVVDSASGTRATAFDPQKLRQAILRSGIDNADVPATLPVRAITPGDDGATIDLMLSGRELRCHTEQDRCSWHGPPHAPDVLWSPDGRRGVIVRDHNLWLRTPGRGDDRALTQDGVAHFAYGTRPGTSYRAIADLRATTPLQPAGLHWSADGSMIVGVRHDERQVEPYPFVESVPREGRFRPKVWQPRIPLMGDQAQTIPVLFAIHVDDGTTRTIDLPDDWRPFHPLIHWSPDTRRFYGLAVTPDHHNKALYEADLRTGATRLIHIESSAASVAFSTYLYSPPGVRVLDASNEFIWFTQSNDWGQLQLRDLKTGRLKRTLTPADRSVRDIIDVDLRQRALYYTSGGRDDDDDPYFTTIWRVGLDGSRPRRLSPADAVHTTTLLWPGQTSSVKPSSRSALSPNGRWLVDTHSTLTTPPISTLRDARTGRTITTLERADASAVLAAGWRSPTRVKLIAADGDTPIWATVYFPPDMQAGQRYPVIDAIYGGPQTSNAPADFGSAIATLNPVSRASLAQLGFIVVTIDARGTPGRSKTFNDVSHGERFAEPQLLDHIEGLRQLAQRFDSLDLDRVGIYGHSLGGYVSARAILTHPEFFKVAVSSAGPHNFQGFYPVNLFFGPPDYGNALRERPDHGIVPAPYDQLDLMPHAATLRGHLLLAYGDLDENAFPALTLQLVDALTRANRRYDLMYLPGRDHNFFRTDAYYTQRMWDYFVEHLLGAEPPQDFDLKLALPDSARFGH